MMTNGVTNWSATVHYSSFTQSQKQGDLKARSQSFSTIFQYGMPARAAKYDVSKHNIVDSIGTVINGLSSLTSDANKTTQRVKVTNDSCHSVTDDTRNDVLIALIEQLLETLQDLVRDDRDDATTTSSEIANAPILLNSGQGTIATSEEIEHSLERQLYSLIEFMQGVNDNLQETGDDRIAELMGYLKEEYEEQRYQDRQNNIMKVLRQFLEK